jgi:hypothetical protein
MTCPFVNIESSSFRGFNGECAVCSVAKQVPLEELELAIATARIHVGIVLSPLHDRGTGPKRFECEVDADEYMNCSVFEYVTTLTE